MRRSGGRGVSLAASWFTNSAGRLPTWQQGRAGWHPRAHPAAQAEGGGERDGGGREAQGSRETPPPALSEVPSHPEAPVAAHRELGRGFRRPWASHCPLWPQPRALPCPRWRDCLEPGLTPSAARGGVRRGAGRPPGPPSPEPPEPCPPGTGPHLPRTGSGSDSSWRQYRSRCWGPKVCRQPESVLEKEAERRPPGRRPSRAVHAALAQSRCPRGPWPGAALPAHKVRPCVDPSARSLVHS